MVWFVWIYFCGFNLCLSINTVKSFLFPIAQSNLFPSTTKPLNIFESRYLEMIDDAIQTNTPIVIGYTPENGDTYRTVGGYGHPQIIDRRSNGTLLVFVTGQGKVIIEDEKPDPEKPYLIVETKIIQENLEISDFLKPKYMTLSTVLAKWVQKNIPEQKQREIFIQSLKSPQEVIGAFAAYLIRDYDLQYEMMEIYSSNEQIEYLYRLFESNELTV
jgi:uncharacterized protein